jgi:hypothetical protein
MDIMYEGTGKYMGAQIRICGYVFNRGKVTANVTPKLGKALLGQKGFGTEQKAKTKTTEKPRVTEEPKE